MAQVLALGLGWVAIILVVFLLALAVATYVGYRRGKRQAKFEMMFERGTPDNPHTEETIEQAAD